jgi:hypothetical protein
LNRERVRNAIDSAISRALEVTFDEPSEGPEMTVSLLTNREALEGALAFAQERPLLWKGD